MLRSMTRLLLVLGVFLVSVDAYAIPAFARKYRMSCSSCHAPAPRLKAFGEEFAGRGFRMEKEEDEPARATFDTGDPLLMLIRDFPIAARIDLHTTYRSEADSKIDFETPFVFKILSGSPIGERMAYYFYFIIEDGDVEGLEDAYLQYNGIFNTPIDLIAGQFQVSDPLFKRELRLSRHDYEIYRVHVGDSPSNLTYDRGLMFSTGLPGDIDAVFSVVNGNGIPKGRFDDDGNKNFSVRLAREFGPARVGAFGYFGTNDLADGSENELTYFGPDLSVMFGEHWQVSAQYLERKDDNPYAFAPLRNEITTRGGFAEIHFFPNGENGRYALTALYNNVDSDDPLALRESASLSFNYLVGRNIRLLTEIGRDLETDENMASVGFAAAF